MKRTIFTLITGLVAAATLSSCLTPGKYRLYRIANAKSEMSPGCFPDGMIPESEAFDTTTFKTGATFAIYAADSDVFYLDMDTVSVEGEKDGIGAYKFKGDEKDYEPFGDGNIITTTILTVKLEKSGRKVTGTSTQDVQVVCSGDQNCPNPSQCITKTSFEGAEIEGVELQHGV
jgi:hypothetical protein